MTEGTEFYVSGRGLLAAIVVAPAGAWTAMQLPTMPPWMRLLLIMAASLGAYRVVEIAEMRRIAQDGYEKIIAQAQKP